MLCQDAEGEPGAAGSRPPAAERGPVLRSLAGRYQQLSSEIEAIDAQLARLVAPAAAALGALTRVRPETAVPVPVPVRADAGRG